MKFYEDNLIEIKTDKYGYEKLDENVKIDPDKWTISRGDTKLDVLMRWGNPAYKKNSIKEIPDNTGEQFLYNGNFYSSSRDEDIDNEYFVKIPVTYLYVDEWSYDFGKNRFPVSIIFNNGRVVDIKK